MAERKPRAKAKTKTQPPDETPEKVGKSARRGGGLKAKQTALRNAALVEYRNAHKGMTWPEVAAEFGLQQRQAMNIYAAWRGEHIDELRRSLAVVSADPTGFIAEKIDEFRQLREGLWELAAVNKGKNDPVAVGAYSRIIDLHGREIDLLQKTGLLPQDLGVIRHVVDLQFAAKMTVEIMAKYLKGAALRAAQDELLAALDTGLARARAAAGLE